MPALFIFLIKVNIALLLFGAGYYLVLRHLTFYTLNRVYLMAAILFASIYPLINLHAFAEKHRQLTRPVQVMILNFQSPAETLLKPVAQTDYWYWAAIVFWLGAALFAIRLAVQLFSLFRLHKASKPGNIYNHKVRMIDSDAGPFSFWRSIYVNPANHQPADLHAIVLHEQVHVNQWHTLDILLAELSTIFYWFNPGIWLMKKAVRENIEFITDRKLLTNGLDSKQYQYSLVNVSFSAPQHTLVNNFNISTIKKRIIMMNAQRSSRLNLTRYLFLVPLLLICLLSFSVTRAAIIKKSKSVYKSIRLTVTKSSGLAAFNTPASLAVKPAVHLHKAPKDTNSMFKNAISVYGSFAAADTAKKTTFKLTLDDGLTTLKDTGKNKSTNYDVKYDYIIPTDTGKRRIHFSTNSNTISAPIIMLNGKIVNLADIKSITPNNILSTGVDKTPDGKTVIWITTKKGVNIAASDPIKINGKLMAADPIRINGQVINKMRVNGIDVTIDTNKMGTKGMLQTLMLTALADTGRLKRTLTVTPNGSVVVTGFQSSKGSPPTIVNVNKSPFSKYTLESRRPLYNNISFDNFADKLFVIDGKIATKHDMKKLSMFDIDHIAVKNSPDMMELYGDKAYRGVVFIVTKKVK